MSGDWAVAFIRSQSGLGSEVFSAVCSSLSEGRLLRFELDAALLFLPVFVLLREVVEEGLSDGESSVRAGLPRRGIFGVDLREVQTGDCRLLTRVERPLAGVIDEGHDVWGGFASVVRCLFVHSAVVLTQNDRVRLFERQVGEFCVRLSGP